MTFYIFSKAGDSNQFCAVRQDQPIPPLLDGMLWEYAGCIDAARVKPYGFDLDQAHEAVRRSGLYYYRREFTLLLNPLRREAA